MGRSCEEATKACETLLGNYPQFTVERHLGNFHWKNPDDLTHYRDGLLKAGLPFSKAFAESTPRGTANS